MCYPVDLEYGKYRIPEDTETFNADLQNAVTAEDRDFFQLGPNGDLDEYARWYAYVMSCFLGLETLDRVFRPAIRGAGFAISTCIVVLEIRPCRRSPGR